MQHLEQVRMNDQDGCDQVANVFMTFDLVPVGPDLEALKALQATEDARLAKGRPLPPQVREQAWNTRLAWLAAGGRGATHLKYKVWSDGCHDIGGVRITCNSPGGRASGEVTLGEETPTGFKVIDQRTLGGGVSTVRFNSMGPSLEIYTTSSGESLAHQFDGTCVSHPSSSTSGFFPVSSGYGGLYVSIEPEPICLGDDPKGENDAWHPAICTPPTACFKPTDEAQRRECISNPGKFAALPFEGNGERRRSLTRDDGFDRQGLVFHKASWKVCCGCGQIGGTHH